ncbi:MAG: phosphoglycolate phosphatase [Paraglaciecola sp.]|jgi:phosphoglycolate phosphatase
MKYKLIIFDWDGTLMDSADKIVQCIQVAAKTLELPVPSAENARNIIGLSLAPALKQLFCIENDLGVEELVKAYRAAFVGHAETSSPLFHGASSLLETLKAQGHLLAVATGKGRRGLEGAWQHTQTGHYFHTSRCADDAQSKPSPDMLQQILEELSLAPHQALMIGDTSYDMAMAESIGMDRIGVSFGVHKAQQLNKHQPLGIIDRLDELHAYL